MLNPARSCIATLAWCVNVLFCFVIPALAQTVPQPGSAADLLRMHASLRARLSNNQFQRPLVLESVESAQRVEGSVYAVLDSPFSDVGRTLQNPVQWCEVMILHLNTKYCRAASELAPTQLKVSIGRKTPQKLTDAFELDFSFNVPAARSDFLAVVLNAPKGPLGTSEYRIELQAAALPENRTFLRMNYAYGYGMASRVAMQGYLSTLGSGKVGFTQVSQGANADYVGGIRGAAERNIMRYYLAIEAYQASLRRPRAEQSDARLAHWFDATEEFPRQLREIDKKDYLAMKKAEKERQQIASP